jgi:phage gp37-like protein
MVSRAAQVFDEHGELRDDAVREQLRKFVTGFVAFAGSRERPA